MTTLGTEFFDYLLSCLDEQNTDAPGLVYSWFVLLLRLPFTINDFYNYLPETHSLLYFKIKFIFFISVYQKRNVFDTSN